MPIDPREFAEHWLTVLQSKRDLAQERKERYDAASEHQEEEIERIDVRREAIQAYLDMLP